MRHGARIAARIAMITTVGAAIAGGAGIAHAAYSEQNDSPDVFCSGMSGYTEANPAKMGDIAIVYRSDGTLVGKYICTINGWAHYTGN